MTPTTLTERLKSETAGHHRAAESQPLQRGLIAGSISGEAYAFYLGQLLRVHAALEAMLDQIAGEQPAIRRVFTDAQHHSVRLHADLVHFGVDPVDIQTLPPTRDLVVDIESWRWTRPAALFGCLYVLEGSMNGNRFIARVLADAFRASPTHGLSYLTPHGDDMPAHWASFKRAFDETVDDTDADIVIAAAKRTFDGVSAICDQLAAFMRVTRT
jgi:heme oxygenase